MKFLLQRKHDLTNLLIMCFLLVTFNTIAEQKVINIAVGEAPPFVVKAENVKGIAIEVVSEALDNKNIAYKYAVVSWTEAEQRVDAAHDLSLWWQKNKVREKKWHFSQVIYKKEFVFLSRKDVRFYWQRLDQLRQYSIGLSRYQSYGQEFDNYIQYLNVGYINSAYSGINALINKELDAVLISKAEAQYLLTYFNNKQKKQLELHEKQVIHTEPYFMVCAKSFRNCNYLIEEFNSGLRELISTKKYDKITEKYLRNKNEN